MKKIHLSRVLSVGIISILVLSSFKTSNNTTNGNNFLKINEVKNKNTSKRNIQGANSTIHSYRINADTYIFDGTAITECNEAFPDSHIFLFEEDGDLMIKRAVGLGSVRLFWLAAEPVKKDIILHIEDQETIKYCDCWIKNDPVWTITKQK